MGSKILNIANAITGIRFIVGIAVMYFIYFGKTNTAVILYILFLLLDMLDGRAARKFKCETRFGKNFDFITDGGIGTGIILILLIVHMLPWQYIALAAIPMIVKTIYIYKGTKIAKGTFIRAKWSKLNGAIPFMIPLMFMIAHQVTVIIAWVIVAYLYVSGFKYAFEIRALEKRHKQLSAKEIKALQN